LRTIIRNNIRQFPFIGDIPILGALFRSTSYQSDQTELVIVVTPHLVTPRKAYAATPADRFVPPSDFELFLFGAQRGNTADLRPEDRALMSIDPTNGGVDGAPMVMFSIEGDQCHVGERWNTREIDSVPGRAGTFGVHAKHAPDFGPISAQQSGRTKRRRSSIRMRATLETPAPGSKGQRVGLAQKRYDTNQVIPPLDIGASNTASVNTSTNGQSAPSQFRYPPWAAMVREARMVRLKP